MSKIAPNKLDAFGNTLEIGDIVAVSGSSYASLTQCRVTEFCGKMIKVKDINYPVDSEYGGKAKRSDQIALVERATKAEKDDKAMYTASEVRGFVNDSIDSCIQLVDASDSPENAIKAMENLKP